MNANDKWFLIEFNAPVLYLKKNVNALRQTNINIHKNEQLEVVRTCCETERDEGLRVTLHDLRVGVRER